MLFLVTDGNKDSTSVIKMIEDLRSGSEAYKTGNSSVSLQLLEITYKSPISNDHEGCVISPKRPSSILNKSEIDTAPGSPWEWTP